MKQNIDKKLIITCATTYIEIKGKATSNEISKLMNHYRLNNKQKGFSSAEVGNVLLHATYDDYISRFYGASGFWYLNKPKMKEIMVEDD